MKKTGLAALLVFGAGFCRAASVESGATPRGESAFPATFAEIPALNLAYATPDMRDLTVTILGSSKGTPDILQYMDMAQKASGELIQRGRNVLTGGGNAGIMGAANQGAISGRQAAERSGLVPGENLSIVVTPAWGDEDLKNARAIGIAESEGQRVDKFQQVSDHYLIFPGGPATLLEAATLISKNHYRGSAPAKHIVLVGSDFFQGLREQYDRLSSAGLLKTPPSELFEVVDSLDEILARFPGARPASETPKTPIQG